MGNIYVTKRLVYDIEFSEIDIEFDEKFGRDYDDDDSDVIEIELGEQGDADGHVIDIDKMINTLQNIKNKGSNYVSLNYHEDHIGYEISGYSIKKSTPEEIQNYEFELMTERERRNKIMELQREIEKLKK